MTYCAPQLEVVAQLLTALQSKRGRGDRTTLPARSRHL